MGSAGQPDPAGGYTYGQGAPGSRPKPPTPSLAQRGSGANPQGLAALLALRDRRKDSASSFEPVSVDMVESVLLGVFEGLGAGRALIRKLAEQIAETLRDDAKAGPRMQVLWDQLESLQTNGTE